MDLDFSTRHACYQERFPTWERNRIFFSGGQVLAEKVGDYLIRFQLEGDMGWASRSARAKTLYENWVKFAVATYTSQIFRKVPERKLQPGQEELQENVDLQGSTADVFFKRVVTAAEVYGISHVLIDAPREVTVANEEGEERPISEQERKDMKLRPWLEHIRPQNLLDWEIEEADVARRGRLNWIVISDPEYVGTKEPGHVSPANVTRFRVWTRSTWHVYTKHGSNELVLSAEGAHELGEVPLVQFYAERIGPMKGETVIDDATFATSAIWNGASVRDESYYYQGFNQLVIKSDDRTLGDLKLGQDRAIKLNRGDDAMYLTPSEVPFEAFAKMRREKVEYIRDLVFHRTSRQTETAQVESAEKRTQDRDEFMALLEDKAKGYESSEAQCWRFLARYLGTKPEEAEDKITCEYNREFTSEDVLSDEWEKRIRNGVASHEEWFMSLHPGVTKEEATKKVEEYLKLASQRMPSAMAARNLMDAGNPFLNQGGNPGDPNAPPKPRPPFPPQPGAPDPEPEPGE